MKNRIFILLTFLTLLALTSCGDFWAPGIRVYKVDTQEFPFTQTNTISISLDLGEVTFHNHATNTLLIVMSNYVDAGGWTVGSNYIEENLLFNITNEGDSLYVNHSGDFQPDYWNIYSIGSKIHVYLPDNATVDTVHVFTETGQITMKNSNYITNADLTTTTGSIICKYSRIQNFQISATTGSVGITTVVADHLNIQTVTGSIHTGDGNPGYGINDFGCSSPDITCTVQTGNIDLSLENVNILKTTSSTGSQSIGIGSFLNSSANVDILSFNGYVDIYVNTYNFDNVWVEARTTTGYIDNQGIPFETEIKEPHYYSGKNQSGSRKIDVDIKTGSVSLFKTF